MESLNVCVLSLFFSPCNECVRGHLYIAKEHLKEVGNSKTH